MANVVKKHGISSELAVSLGINNDTQVVGAYVDQEQRSLGFLRAADGTYTPIELPQAKTGPGVFDINDRKQIVGIYGTFVDDEDAASE